MELQAQFLMNIHQSSGAVQQVPTSIIDSVTYTIINTGNAPALTTNLISSITDTSAISGGIILNDGGALITERGICYGISTSPTIANSVVLSTSVLNNFSCNITNLNASTQYYVRSYAISSNGIGYGNEVVFTTGSTAIQSNPGVAVNYFGYSYPTIVLGNGQEWFAENLKTSYYSNGDPIPYLLYQNFASLSSGARCYLYNDSQFEDDFGKLYNWYAVTDSRNICPTGWHVPSDPEWTDLIDYLDPSITFNTAGAKMKVVGTQMWEFTNSNVTNESGFSAVGSGGIGYPYEYSMYYNGLWWTTTSQNANTSWVIRLNTDMDSVIRETQFFTNGYSVRCLKD